MRFAIRIVSALMIAVAGALVVPAASVALPVAAFTFAPSTPITGEPVAFAFTGSCDAPPCRVAWRWFETGGSSLGTTMGEGGEISYTFVAPGVYSVVVEITNALPTHGSATETQVVRVIGAPPPPPPASSLSASFVSTSSAPVVAEPVGFSFTGSCDLAPCRIQWRWFRNGSSSLGTTMGEGADISYQFDTAGVYRVVVQITNAGSTHGSATATKVLTVGPAPGSPIGPLVDDAAPHVDPSGWSARSSGSASQGGYRVGHGRATLRFLGRRVVYVAVTGPDLGVAALRVDRRAARHVDLYSPTPSRRSWSLRAAPGRHVVSVRSTGFRSAESSGSAITLDGFVVGVAARRAVNVDDRSVRVSYGPQPA